MNGCVEIQTYLISAIQARSTASEMMGINYDIYNNNVLVPMMWDDYQQLMGMFQAPYQLVDERLGVYLVKMHIIFCAFLV